MDDQNQKVIGRRIRAAREEAGLSQEELGEKVGYSAMGISHLENGDRKIKIEDLQKIAEAIEAQIAYLLEPITKQSYPTTIYRRGDEDVTDEQKRDEQKALDNLDDLIKTMDD